MANNPIVNMFKVKELRERIFFTLVVLAVFRLGSVLTIPGINPQALTAYFDSLTRGNAFVDYMDFFAGGAFSQYQRKDHQAPCSTYKYDPQYYRGR